MKKLLKERRQQRHSSSELQSLSPSESSVNMLLIVSRESTLSSKKEKRRRNNCFESFRNNVHTRLPPPVAAPEGEKDENVEVPPAEDAAAGVPPEDAVDEEQPRK